MSENVYSAPKSNLVGAKGTDIAIWNPDAAGAWSLLFTPIFGSILVYKNWKSVGEIELANKSKKWIYISLFMAVISLIISLVGFVYMCTWYFMSQKKQSQYLKSQFDGVYQKKSWAKPLLIALGFWACAVFILFSILSSFSGYF